MSVDTEGRSPVVVEALVDGPKEVSCVVFAVTNLIDSLVVGPLR